MGPKNIFSTWSLLRPRTFQNSKFYFTISHGHVQIFSSGSSDPEPEFTPAYRPISSSRPGVYPGLGGHQALFDLEFTPASFLIRKEGGLEFTPALGGNAGGPVQRPSGGWMGG
jgi:hypothetical protein